MLTLTVDDQQVQVEEGTTILDAAKQLDIEIPTLCYHPAIEPYSACRVCLVEIVDGDRSRLAASCSYPVEDGLVIKTNSEQVLEVRKMMIELLLARAPKAEKIQEMAAEMGITEPRFPADEKGDDCILCGLCVRACEAVVGRSVVNFVNRGDQRLVSTAFDESSEDCITCGACALVCPTECIKIEEVDQIKHSEMTRRAASTRRPASAKCARRSVSQARSRSTPRGRNESSRWGPSSSQRATSHSTHPVCPSMVTGAFRT